MPYKDPTSDKARANACKRNKKWYAKNREKELLKNKTEPARLKSGRIQNWKGRGVVGDLNKLYKIWLDKEQCDVCKYVFIGTKNKCLDHDHDTGLFRKILCRNCNNWDHWKDTVSKNGISSKK